jgi:hypothetical protein
MQVCNLRGSLQHQGNYIATGKKLSQHSSTATSEWHQIDEQPGHMHVSMSPSRPRLLLVHISSTQGGGGAWRYGPSAHLRGQDAAVAGSLDASDPLSTASLPRGPDRGKSPRAVAAAL